MHHIRILFLFLTSLFVLKAAGQPFDIPEVQLTTAEQTLFSLINDYRQQKGLPPVKLSKNLTRVARLHVQDLAENLPYNRRCNLHSWSDKGPWTPCCYTEDHARAACMWYKPQEISNYTGFGYEIAYWTDEPLSPVNFARKALAGWQRSLPHNTVIVNQGPWRTRHWNAMGIGVYKGYAAVWFGEEEDRDELGERSME